MSKNLKRRSCAVAAALAFSAAPALGQEVPIENNSSSSGEADVPSLNGQVADRIIVYGSAFETEQTEELARIRRRPGAVDLRPAEDFLDNFADNLSDTVFFAPGVTFNAIDTQEIRLIVRGNGIGTSFERRGITLLRDGIPITSASGSSNVQEIDPLTINFIEVYRGGNGLRFGAGSLGGAINILSPTGLNEPSGVLLRGEGGSFGAARLHASAADQIDRFDYYTSFTAARSDGFRDQNRRNSQFFNANAGYKFSSTVDTRFYVEVTNNDLELAGGLSLDDALNNRRMSAPAVTTGPFFPGGPVITLADSASADDFQRDLLIVRLANKTTWDTAVATVELGGHYTYRDLFHPITDFAGLIDQDGHEGGVFARLTGDFTFLGLPTEFTVGADANYGVVDTKSFENNFGIRGALQEDERQQSANVVGYGQLDADIGGGFSVITGLQLIYTERDFDVTVGTDQPNRIDFFGAAPRIGLLWDGPSDVQLFANVTRSYEPPSFTELTGGGALNFTGLEAQTGLTFEGGTRGTYGPARWDVTYFYSLVDEELLRFGAPGAFGFISFTENAEDTVHQGVELGFDLDVFDTFFETFNSKLSIRQVYTYSQFNFVNDTQFGDNELAGVPRHVYRGEIRYSYDDRAFVAFNGQWVPENYFADFANTTEVPSYSIVGFSAGIELSDTVSLFVSGENLADTRYISGVSTNANQALEQGRIFVPGEGRSFFGGLRTTF